MCACSLVAGTAAGVGLICMARLLCGLLGSSRALPFYDFGTGFPYPHMRKPVQPCTARDRDVHAQQMRPIGCSANSSSPAIRQQRRGKNRVYLIRQRERALQLCAKTPRSIPSQLQVFCMTAMQKSCQSIKDMHASPGEHRNPTQVHIQSINPKASTLKHQYG